MIKLNMKKIAELEKQNAGNEIYLNTLQQMIDMIMMPTDPMGSNTSAVAFAMSTLKDLKVIDDDREVKKSIEPLNS